MKQLVNKSFAEKFGSEPAGAAYLLKRQIQKQLKALLTDYQKPVIETNDVILKGLEEKIFVRAFGAKFEGRLDRIEQRGSSIVILDYKTGAKPSKAPINFGKLNIDERETWNEASHHCSCRCICCYMEYIPALRQSRSFLHIFTLAKAA